MQTATIGLEQEISTRFEDFVNAWNRHDPRAMASVWAEDAHMINPFGRGARGRSEIEKVFHDEQTTVMKDTTFKPGNQSIRELRPDLLLVEYDAEIMGIPGAPQPVHVHVNTVMEKQGGTWYALIGRPVIYQTRPQAK